MGGAVVSTETFGSYVVRRRKKRGLSQKELASLILREEDGKAISPQYLNDIERDRRQPTSEHLIKQIADALHEENADYLLWLAGTIPNELRSLPKEKVAEVFKAFRRPIDK
jgi:transcriptional regulator with XRE-family HTH domain